MSRADDVVEACAEALLSAAAATLPESAPRLIVAGAAHEALLRIAERTGRKGAKPV